MKRWAPILVVGAIVAGGYFVMTRAPAAALLDEDCPEEVHYPTAIDIYKGTGNDEDVAVIDDNGALHRVAKDHASFDPGFSPDGRELVFVTGRGRWEESTGWPLQSIEVIDIDGSGRRKLTDGRHLDSEPAWSPDGNLIAFARYGVGVMVVAVEGESHDSSCPWTVLLTQRMIVRTFLNGQPMGIGSPTSRADPTQVSMWSMKQAASRPRSRLNSATSRPSRGRRMVKRSPMEASLR